MAKKFKKGFSLVELMLLLLIVSLITAGGMSVITRKHVRIPTKIVHGTYICAYTTDGRLYEEKYVEKKLTGERRYINSAAGEKCKFVPPKKANYFYIQVVGAGGGGGDAGYDGGSRTTETIERSGGPLGLSLSSFEGLSEEDWPAVKEGHTVTAVARAEGGTGGCSCGCPYVSAKGDCYCSTTSGGSTNNRSGYTSDQCETFCGETGNSVLKNYTYKYIGYGGDGGDGGSCEVSLPLELGMEGDGDNYSGYGGSGSARVDCDADGSDGNKAEAHLSDASSNLHCEADGGEGGTAAYCPSSCTEGNDETENGRDGRNGSRGSSYSTGGIYYDGALNGGLTWTHQYDINYVMGGDGGYAGEYKALFVRSFKTDTIELEPGKGGIPGVSGGDGGKGQDSILAGVVVAQGGGGGAGSRVQSEILPPNGTTYEDIMSWVTSQGGVFTKTYNVPGYMGKRSMFTDAANMAGMKDIPPSADTEQLLLKFGRGGDGGRSTNNCWVGTHIRTLEGVRLKASYIAPSCSSSFTNGTPQTGGPGAIVIVW